MESAMSMTKPAEETAVYDISMKHDEDSLFALAHMQYDLFSTRNFIVRNLLSLVLIGVGRISSCMSGGLHCWPTAHT